MQKKISKRKLRSNLYKYFCTCFISDNEFIDNKDKMNVYFVLKKYRLDIFTLNKNLISSIFYSDISKLSICPKTDPNGKILKNQSIQFYFKNLKVYCLLPSNEAIMLHTNIYRKLKNIK